MNFKLYKCCICGELYDEQYGDPESGLPAGTRYEDIPDNWTCPSCGATKQSLVGIND